MGLLPELTRFQTPGLEPSSVKRDDLTKPACVYFAQDLLYFQVGCSGDWQTDRLQEMKHVVLVRLPARSVQQWIKYSTLKS